MVAALVSDRVGPDEGRGPAVQPAAQDTPQTGQVSQGGKVRVGVGRTRIIPSVGYNACVVIEEAIDIGRIITVTENGRQMYPSTERP